MSETEQQGQSTAIVRQAEDPPWRLAQAFAKSGYWKDVRDAAQAIVKIEAGREIGIGPIAAMNHVYVVNGRTAGDSMIHGALVKKCPTTDYQVIEWESDLCEIAFLELKPDGKGGQEWKEVFRSKFTAADADQAGLLGKETYRKYPRNMLFARAMTNGVRTAFPHLIVALPYTVEELGEETDERGAPLHIQVIEPRRNGEKSGREQEARQTWRGLAQIAKDYGWKGPQEELLSALGFEGLGAVQEAVDADGLEAMEMHLVEIVTAEVERQEKAAHENWYSQLQAAAAEQAKAQPHAPSRPMTTKAVLLIQDCFPEAGSQKEHDDLRHRFAFNVFGRRLSQMAFGEVRALLDALENPQGQLLESAKAHVQWATNLAPLPPETEEEKESHE